MIFVHEYFPGYMHSYAVKYMKILEENNLKYQICNSHDSGFWAKMNEDNLLLFYTGTDDMHLLQLKSVLNVINQYTTVKCFPDYATSWHLDDKVSQYFFLKAQGMPVVESYVFWDKQLAESFVDEAEYPLVFKLKGGAGSLNVRLINNSGDARKLIKAMFGTGIKGGSVPGINSSTIFNSDYRRVLKSKLGGILATWGVRNKPYHSIATERSYIYFQKFLKDNDGDTRVTVIGERAFAFRRRNRKGDFRSSGSGIIDFDQRNVDIETIKICFMISRKLGFQTMAYDLLRDEDGGYKIVEMCHIFADWAVYECPGYWDPELNWHEGHFWPQYSQLCDLLSRSDMVQPWFSHNVKTANLVRVNR